LFYIKQSACFKNKTGVSPRVYISECIATFVSEHAMNKDLWGCVLLACVGLSLLLPGAYFLGKTALQWMHYEATEGVVEEIQYRRATATGGAEMAYPVVRFRTAEGVETTVPSTRGYSRCPFQAGDRVPVRYNPEQPQEAVIATFFEAWGLGAVLLGVGLAFLLGSALSYTRMG
jgi:hypothetical protein